MSLPPATKDVSNKPAAGSVVDPVNKTAKDADVDRKVCTWFIGYVTELEIKSASRAESIA